MCWQTVNDSSPLVHTYLEPFCRRSTSTIQNRRIRRNVLGTWPCSIYFVRISDAFAITLETFIPIFRSFFRRNRVFKLLVSRVACTHNTETKRRSNPANRVVPITVRTGSCTYDFASEMKFI